MKTNIKNLIEASKNLNIMIVEDNEEVKNYLCLLLSDIFENIVVASNGLEALEIYQKQNIDLIITDLNMPKMDGIELIENIRKKDNLTPIIILSAYNESSYFMKGIELGISGYVLKPISIDALIKVLTNSIEVINLRLKVHNQKVQLEEINTDLEQQMIKRISEIYALNQEIKDTQKEVVFTMGAIGESRSKETGNHVRRVSLYSELFGQYYGLSKDEVTLLKEASPMHDIGKVAIPDTILNKAGKLTDEEMDIMKTHTTLGFDMLKHSQRDLLKIAAVVSHEHHEKYDGSGYPQGLKGEEISIYARITAIADVFDALGSNRVYKKAWNDEAIFRLFKEERGKHFDSKLVDIFFEHLNQFLDIRNSYQDI